MLKLVKLVAVEPDMQKRLFRLVVEKDGNELTSDVLLVKDGEDWVFQEEGNQRFGASEMRAIAKELDKLNGRYEKQARNFGISRKRVKQQAVRIKATRAKNGIFKKR